MKERILRGWTFQRGLYALLGSLILVQAIADGQWIMVAFGAYFAAMGIFRFGCAAGTCLPAYQNNTVQQNIHDITDAEDADYEEVRST